MPTGLPRGDTPEVWETPELLIFLARTPELKADTGKGTDGMVLSGER